jgi:hypothetical protein
VLLGGASLGAGALAVVGGLALGGPGLVGAGLAATLAGCTAAGIAREAPAHSRSSALEAAVWAAGSTAGVVLVVAGMATVGGGVVATLAVLAAATVVVVRWTQGQRRQAPTSGQRDRPADVVRLPVGPTQARPAVDRGLVPVATLTTRDLGDEWLRTTAALAGRLTPAVRTSLVRRREEVLDEFERRDPEGFGRWLSAGPVRGSDPADFVRGGPARRGPVADTDAA